MEAQYQFEKILKIEGHPDPSEPIGGAVAEGYVNNEFASVGPVYVGMTPSTAKRILALCQEFKKFRSSGSNDYIIPEKLSFFPFPLGIKVILYNAWQVDSFPSAEWRPNFKITEIQIREEDLPRVGNQFLSIDSQGSVKIEITERFSKTSVFVELDEKSLQDVAAGPGIESCCEK